MSTPWPWPTSSRARAGGDGVPGQRRGRAFSSRGSLSRVHRPSFGCGPCGTELGGRSSACAVPGAAGRDLPAEPSPAWPRTAPTPPKGWLTAIWKGSCCRPQLSDRLMVEDAAFRGLVLSSVAARFSDLEDMVQALVFTGLPSRLAGALLSAASAPASCTPRMRPWPQRSARPAKPSVASWRCSRARDWSGSGGARSCSSIGPV